MTWFEFIAALFVFFALHAVPVRPRIKSRIVSATGPRAFTVGYSAVSLVTLTWLIVAAGRAPTITLWPLLAWHKHLALALMLIAVLILSLGLGRPNPLSFGGTHNDRFDPERPGLVGWVRHPLLAAIGLWSLAHLIVNGTLAHVILFGLFAGFSLLGMRIIDSRKRRTLGADWSRLANRRREFALTRGGTLRAGMGVLFYAALLMLHPIVIGVTPLP